MGNRNDWETPWALINKIKNIWGPITFDLAASRGNAKADMYCSQEERDFLTYDFSKVHECHLTHGFLNPPFSRKEEFLEKAFEASKYFRQITALVPNNARETAWWQDYALYAYEIVNLSPRVNFSLPEDQGLIMQGVKPVHSGPNFGCCLLIFRPFNTSYCWGAMPRETYLNWHL